MRRLDVLGRLLQSDLRSWSYLIAGHTVVPELIQQDFTAENIVQHLEPLLPDGPPRQSMMEELARIHAQLNPGSTAPAGAGAINRVARIALEMVQDPGGRPPANPTAAA